MADVKYKTRKCLYCGGKGYVKSGSGYNKCGICNGRGYLVDKEVYIDTHYHKKIFIINNPTKK